MSKTTIVIAALGLALTAGSALAQSSAAILPAQRGAVFITKDDFAKALAARAAGSALGVVGAVRAGDDRINVDVLRRDTPDEGPVTHDVVTEIYYILEGGGDFATGGTLLDAKPMLTNGRPTNPASIGPSEKGSGILGGTTRHVSAGDVVMLPPNVPHGFTKLDGHVTYMVVRVNPGYEKGKSPPGIARRDACHPARIDPSEAAFYPLDGIGARMVSRPIWQGHLRLSLVTCPVALYSAVQPSGDVHFNLLHKDTHNRIHMMPTDPDLGPVERSDLVKGFEYAKGQYVVVTQDEIDKVRLESTRTIDIDRFVAADEIDRLYWDSPYFLAPDGKLAAEAFAVIREAMVRTGQIALGRVVMHQRERLLAVEPRGRGMIAWSLRSRQEVRKEAEFFADIPERKIDPHMIAVAEKIIEQQEGRFDPDQFNDRYEDALRALIEKKRKGKAVVAAAEPEDTKVVDLMEALRRSPGKSGGARQGQSEPEPKSRGKTRAGGRR